MINEQTIRQLIHDAGLDEFAEGIVKLIQPTIAMRVQPSDENTLKIGASRFGGSPDLPEGVQWPRWRDYFVPFWCQLNLAEVAAFDTQGILPKTGMLYFFSVMGVYDVWFWQRGFDGTDQTGWKVIYYNSDISHLHRVEIPAPMPLEGRIPSCAVEFSQRLTIPYGGINGTRQIRELGLTDEQEEDYVFKVYFELKDKYQAEDGEKFFFHQIIGWPGTIQLDLSHSAEIGFERLTWTSSIEQARLDNWRLLFQIDGDDPIMHTLSVYFMIHQTDLAAGNFDRVWCDQQGD